MRGVKAHAEIGGASRWGLEVIKLGKRISSELGVPLYIHLGQLWPVKDGATIDPDEVVQALMPLMEPGDVLAHPFTRHPGGFVSAATGEVHPVVWAALERGVTVDVGHGSHFSFEMARRTLAAGIRPHTLGADMHGYNVRVPGDGDAAARQDNPFFGVAPFNLTHAMTELLTLGIPLPEVVATVTSNPATHGADAGQHRRLAAWARGRHLGARPAARPLHAVGQQRREGHRAGDAHARLRDPRRQGDASRQRADPAACPAGGLAMDGSETIHHTVPAGGRFSTRLDAGDLLRIVDTHGQQAVDFLCYAVALPADRYNAPNTMKINGNIYLGKGTKLYSDRAQVLMRIIEDTCGRHDTIGGCCSAWSNFTRYGVKDTPGCHANFIAELARWSLSPSDVVANVNFFMNVPGATGWRDGHRSRPLQTGRLR